jgi:hypothetical protein
MALIINPGGRDSESYNSVVDMLDYLTIAYTAEQVATWTDLDLAAQEHRMRLGVLFLDELPLRGARACRDQRLAFPRWWKTDLDYPSYQDQYIEMEDIPVNISTRDNYYGSPPVIPEEIKKAHMELTFQILHHYLLGEDSDILAYPEHEVRAFTLGGGMTIEYFSSTHSQENSWSKAKITSAFIINTYLHKWLRRAVGGII